jgi:hypothetical protein
MISDATRLKPSTNAELDSESDSEFESSFKFRLDSRLLTGHPGTQAQPGHVVTDRDSP